MTRGSWRAGSPSRAVSGAIASHPTKESISADAARPTAAAPCGANGVQCSARAAGAEPSTATATSTTSTPTRASCTEVVARAPAAVTASTIPSSPAAATAMAVRPPPHSAPGYPPPIRPTTGAPHTAPARKHQTTARPARSPNPTLTHPATPAPPGNRVPTAVNTVASAPDTTSRRRTKGLEAGGIIAGCRAELDRGRAGLGLTVFIALKVNQHSRETSRLIEGALTAIPAVVACYVVSGEADFLVDFLVEEVVPDLGAYEGLLLGQILAIEPVTDARSTFAIRTVLSRGPLPVDQLR
jgi:Lrp/AsnC family leucine-responsive transcriptional regulator